MSGDDASDTPPLDARARRYQLAEAELQECHQHYRAASDQAFKAVAFLTTAIAVLLTVAIERKSALALVVIAIIPLAGNVIATYIGRQFGAATTYGAILEHLLHRSATGFFWGHLRSANYEGARKYQTSLESWGYMEAVKSEGPHKYEAWLERGDLPEHRAWVTYSPTVRYLPLAYCALLVVFTPILVLAFDWELL